ncbi:MAG: hypothetical protein AB2L13_10260 [Spirochaetota bacterium]
MESSKMRWFEGEGMSDCVALIFGVGQVVMGAGIAVWAVFKTKKDSAALQNENIKLQLQQQKQMLVFNAFREFRRSRDQIDTEFGDKFSGKTYKSQSLLVTSLYFPRLRSAIFALNDSLSLFGSRNVLEICDEIGKDIYNLSEEYAALTNDLYVKEPPLTIGDPLHEEWAEDCINAITIKIVLLKSIYHKHESKLIDAVRKDMEIEL